MIRLLPLILTALMLPLLAAPLDEERLWTGKNGKSFRGIFIRVVENGAKAEIASNTGKVFTIDIDNLIAGDRLLIRSAMAKKKAAEDEAKARKEAKKDKKEVDEDEEPEGFKRPPVTPRATLIAVDPDDVGSRKSDPVLNTLWQFVCWWDARDILPIPKKGDAEDRMEWAHERLARYCRVRSGTSVIRPRQALEGLAEYFEENLANLATVNLALDTDFNPETLQRYCDGINAVTLKMTMTYAGGSREYTACAALESIDEKGNAVLHVWGQRKNARITIKDRRPNRAVFRAEYLSQASSSYTVTFDNLDGIPDHIRKQKPSFLLDPNDHDVVILAKPHLFEVAGQRRPRPKDPLFERRMRRPGEPVKIPEAAPIALPFEFGAPSPLERVWTFDDGSTFEGQLAFENERTATLRDRRGKTRELNVESLTPEDQARYHFAHGCAGYGASPSRLELEYRLRSQRGGTYDFVISVQGTLARVDCKQTARTLVFDLKDNAYRCWKGSTYRYLGRWCEFDGGHGGLVPHPGRPTMDEKEKRENFTQSVRVARKSPDFDFPARFAQFPLETQTFRNPKIDFTLMQDRTATVALYQILYTSAPAAYDPERKDDPTRRRTIVFSNGSEVGCHRGIRELGHRFIRHHMLPLRMSWSNAVNTAWVDRENQIKTSGSFEIALMAARVPETFPEDHFMIPEEARSAEMGTCIHGGK